MQNRFSKFLIIKVYGTVESRFLDRSKESKSDVSRNRLSKGAGFLKFRSFWRKEVSNMEQEFLALREITSRQFRGGSVSEVDKERIHNYVLKVPQEDRERIASRLWPYEGTD